MRDSRLHAQASLPLQVISCFRYRYLVVDEQGALLRQEALGRTACLPTGLPDGSVLLFSDTWLVRLQLRRSIRSAGD